MVLENELFAVVFSCGKFRSYISNALVKFHTYHDGLKEILKELMLNP
jgi:hypothetical protein